MAPLRALLLLSVPQRKPSAGDGPAVERAVKEPEEPPALTSTSRVEFHELVVHREPGRPVLLGCPAARRFLEVEEATLRAVQLVPSCADLGEVERRLQDETGKEYDVVAFVDFLRQRGFVKSVDGRPLAAAGDGRVLRWLRGIPTDRFAWLRAPWIGPSVFFLTGLWLVLIATIVPDAAPSFIDLFILQRPGLLLLTVVAGLLAFGAVHELAHYGMARAYGIDATITTGRRFTSLVLQTDVTNAWILPSRARLAIFLSGIAYNLAAASVAGLAVTAIHLGLLPLPEAAELALRFLVLLHLLPLVFQLFFFARTDLYFVLLEALGERNLVADAKAYLRLRVARLRHRVSQRPSGACGTCGRRVFLVEPFCLRCGQRTGAPEQGKRGPLRFERPTRILGFAVLWAAGVCFGAFLFATVFLRYLVAFAVLGLAAWRTAAATGDLIAASEALILLGAVAAQSVMLVQGLLWGSEGRRTRRPKTT